MTVRVHHDNPRAFDGLLRSVPIGEQPVQLSAGFTRKNDASLFMRHSKTESHFHTRIQLLITEH